MRSFAVLVVVVVLGACAAAAGWVAINYWAPGAIGTPAHAGAISQGHPENCTNANISIRPRDQATYDIPLQDGDYVRGTFETDGGFGRVDVIMRLNTPNGDQLLQTARVGAYDFTFPSKMRGAYTIVFDNRYSMYTSKNVALYYCVERNTPRPPDSAPPLG